MYAYCNNCPISHKDEYGTIAMSCFGDGSGLLDLMPDVSGGCASAEDVLLGAAVAAVVLTGAVALENDKREVYLYAQSAKDVTADKYDNKQPRVHHIVPEGSFSTRNPLVVTQLAAAQTMMRKADIDISSDPNNLMVVSHGLHKSLHSNVYLLGVSAAILATDGTKEGIYEALFWLRISITAYDTFAGGY